MSDSKTFGFLRTCMDKRFVAATRAAFERASGLSSNDYWHESYAGGSAVPAANNVGEEYAAAHGAVIFGWQAHINNCGGQPGVSDREIGQRLDSVIQEKLRKYPQARHFRIVASEAGIDIHEVSE